MCIRHSTATVRNTLQNIRSVIATIMHTENPSRIICPTPSLPPSLQKPTLQPTRYEHLAELRLSRCRHQHPPPKTPTTPANTHAQLIILCVPSISDTRAPARGQDSPELHSPLAPLSTQATHHTGAGLTNYQRPCQSRHWSYSHENLQSVNPRIAPLLAAAAGAIRSQLTRCRSSRQCGAGPEEAVRRYLQTIGCGGVSGDTGQAGGIGMRLTCC